MSSNWKNNLSVSIFGESHGPAIGCVLDGLPSGIAIDEPALMHDMQRRSAFNNRFATPRKEKDVPQILSGLYNGYTTGTPVCAVIGNTDTKSGDYAKTMNLARPGHADYTGFIRYGGFQDHRGGGHFSGRLTAPLVFAGAVAKQVLRALEPACRIGSRIVSIADVTDTAEIAWQDYESLHFSDPKFPMVTEACIPQAQEAIVAAMKEHDSTGGVIECFITGLPAGIGDPMFGSVESVLSSLMFSVPAVKGIEFGLGFPIARLRGSEANDSFVMNDTKVETLTNNNGGINGGITNGMPIVFRCAVKPTPSIGMVQQTVNMAEGTNTELLIEGRHDPCIAARAFVVIEAAAALGMLDLVLGRKRTCLS